MRRPSLSSSSGLRSGGARSSPFRANTFMLLLSVCVALSSAWVSLLSTSSGSRRAKSITTIRRHSDVSLASMSFQDGSDSSNNSLAINSQQSLNAMISNNSPSSDSSSSSESKSISSRRKQKLPRSERKAIERKKKTQQKGQLSSGKQKNNASFTLHSTAVSQLTSESTADDVLRAIKRAQKQHDHHDLRVIAKFLIEECDVGFAYGYRGSLLARLAVAALRWENHVVARRAIDIRRLEYRASMMPMESSAIIRGLLRTHNDTDALEILQDELALPLEGTALDSLENQSKIKHRARSLCSIASRHFFESEPKMAVLALQMMTEVGPIARQSKLTAEDLKLPWLRLMQGAAQCEAGRRDGSVTPCVGPAVDHVILPCNLVYSVLSAMSTFPSENDDLVYEAVSNALVRRVVFITGAVDMTTLPPADRGEAAFIGRSNVGKSSLINMATNRKSLAYTSKTPGKTQQFNFFAVNDKPGREKEVKYGDIVEGERDADSFYLVDLPGFGFAKAPEAQRKAWASFMGEYLANRKTLKVVFHLIDSRHGPIDEDSNIMKQVKENLPKNVAYVIVLTKADKNVKGNSKKNPGKVSEKVMDDLKQAMAESGVSYAPILITSAESKLGRDSMWRYLRLAAES
ncbi:GTP-binding protein engB [Nitzschia inconspicua]|uniref:GTP-binding protein engB n=1 Tax=Nitzschia inconspicua TaxID=303405 RepID=A0A9K3KHS7_9STRA|nr:GTP-binding protein engB [Nitzschia inconspicua]